jgi:creatinine amidohydrolase
MKLEERTWKEIAEYLKAERRLIVPVGTCEQHGPHLPLNTDTLKLGTVLDFVEEK